ncbi:hypothetical protein AYO45_01775 [Gammaproteobacteria bacterium SCGC AG-212-F23]|nr:hypothetical protein AYO45_01775 [Gammaproteobacteria bacterium SCGC AG-212-F23]
MFDEKETNHWNIYPESLMHYTGQFWIFWKDINSKYLGCNIYMAKALGLHDPKEIIGMTDHDFSIPKNESDYFILCDKEVMRSRETKQFWDTFTHCGETLHLVAIKSPLILNGEVKGIYGMSYIRNMPKNDFVAGPLDTKNIFNLTDRELEVMQYIVRAKTAKESASILQISTRTVEKHIENAKLKTNCKTRSALIALLLPYFNFR